MKRLGILASLALACAAAWILWKNLDALVLQQALVSLKGYSIPLLLATCALAALSFLIAGLYEAAALKEGGNPLGLARPLLVACIAYPVGHVVSLSTLGAGAIRLRMYSGWGMDGRSVGRVIVLTSLPYLLGVTLLLSLSVVLASEPAATALRLPRSVVVAGGVGGLLASAGYLVLVLMRSFKALPSWGLTCLQVICGVIEILLVAAVLYLLLPDSPAIGWTHFLPLYLIGVLAGQFSSLPAGLGVLEASLILMLPQIPKDKLMAAVLAYRVVFELLPLIAGLALYALYETGSRRGVIGQRWRSGLARNQ